ncbi:unnamed protein product [Schistosoma curassoni]|uniref:FERM domain-containing protein n=1 Tax=Schistosoma curassoni TaxID=6186 RepID=A0A183JQ86_9TREM|nr:unnamed protein product [Schistosoma curassoni]
MSSLLLSVDGRVVFGDQVSKHFILILVNIHAINRFCWRIS